MTGLSVARTWLLGLCLIAPGVHALTCSNASIAPSNPDAAYSINADDTVTHRPTGLVWKRCSEGQIWDGSTCSGTASSHTWAQALTLARSSSFAGQTDWRLPNLKELRSLVEECRVNPAINDSVFPGASGSVVWSGSPYAGGLNGAWSVSFGYGFADGYYDRRRGFAVRLVRGGQLFGPFGLTFSKTGVGRVSTTAAPGVDCGALCGSYPTGTMLTLSATPAANFVHWGGACAGSGTNLTCILTMNVSKEVSASFIDPDTPNVSGLPERLTFALQNLGSNSATQPITLRNSGTLPLAISSIGITGDFAVTHNCAGSLAAGAACQLNVSFAPSVVGARSGNLTISSNAPGSPHSVALSGTGQGGVLSVSPSSLSFSGTNTGTVSAAQNVTISNVGGAAVNLGSFVVNGEFARTTTCGAVLLQGTNCSVSVYFAPLTVGPLTGSLSISSDAPGNPHTVSLSGSGVETASIRLSATTLGFTGQAVGSTSAVQAVTLSNTGTGSLGLTSISATGDFAVINNCGVGLGAGAACSLSITFTPTATGVRSGRIDIVSNLGTHVVYLLGNGAFLSQSIGPIALNPPSFSVGTSATLSATGGGSGNALRFATTTPQVCSVVGSYVTGKAVGVCTIIANQSGNATYADAATGTQGVLVGQASQSIGSIAFNPSTLAVGMTTTATATASSGLAVTFTSTTPTICTVSGSTVTGVAAGTCSITASQSGNSTFAAATTVSQSIAVGLASQTIGTISFNPTSLSVGGTSTASATATSGLAVAFSSTNPTICTVSGSVISGLSAGTCTITASQAGNTNYAAATAVTQSIAVGQGNQTIGSITFNPATLAIGGITTASATATSGLAVAFSSTTPTTCTVSGSTVTGVAAGTCAVAANQAGNANHSAAPQVTANIIVTTVNPPRLMNLSTRGQVSTGDNVMIGGFIISGSTPKKVLIRAVGPNLASYGVTGVLANPMIELHRSSDGSIVASNDDWGSAANAAEVTATTLAPVNAKEAAILSTLDPGAYTAIVTGNGGGTGVGIVEVYELDRPDAPLINISTRGSILTGDKIMIGGFIIQGDAPQTVLIRAVGPTLANYGVSGTLANPTLELHKSSDGSIIASNDDWNSAPNATAVTATGLAPQNALESAILITLEPGAYTAVVSGKDGGTGVGIVEVFAR